MATIKQRGDKWRAQIRLRGKSKSATFLRHNDAKAWVAREEAKIMDGIQGNAARNHTFADILTRYMNEVTPSKRGQRSETYRIKRVIRTDISNVLLSEIRPQDFADWRDVRLQEVSPDSVKRELTTLSSICEHAMKEWGLLNDNPVRKISKPQKSKARTRRPTNKEITDICEALLCDPNQDPNAHNFRPPELVMQRIALALLFAIETAMRAGEICGLQWSDISTERRIAHLRMTKNGDSREVPLSSRALEIISMLRGIDEESVFSVDVGTLDALFRRARDKCGIEDLHFHDTRREALTRMSKKVPVEMLAKISGHRDLRILLNVYYRPDMSEIANLLG